MGDAISRGCNQQKMGADTLWADSGKTSWRELDVGRGEGRGSGPGRSTNGMIYGSIADTHDTLRVK